MHPVPLTRADPNVVITARVLDKANPAEVLYQRSLVDTPEADPVLTSEQFLSLSGVSLPMSPDLPGAPVTNGTLAIGVYQDNYDGKQPAAVATFDNLELRLSELPPVGVERAVQITWPVSTATDYILESAPAVEGPWQPVQVSSPPGVEQVTVPTSELARFFRLR